MMNIYLAGGMKGHWQDRIMAAAPQHQYIDPRAHGLIDERDYTAWDLLGVRSADLVFACMTADNPSGYGMCLEIGYAAALGKLIIFVDERSAADPRFAKYMGMCRQVSVVHATSIDDGIRALLGLK